MVIAKYKHRSQQFLQSLQSALDVSYCDLAHWESRSLIIKTWLIDCSKLRSTDTSEDTNACSSI